MLHATAKLHHLVEIHEGGRVIDTADQVDLAVNDYLLGELFP